MGTSNYFLPLKPNTYHNISIDWGDGTFENYVGTPGYGPGGTANNPIPTLLTHVYPASAVYNIKITPNIANGYPGFYQYGFEDDTNYQHHSRNMLRVNNYGNSRSRWTNLDHAFSRCTRLSSIPSITSYDVFENVNSAALAWAYCSSLRSFPFINTRKISNFTGTWCGCTSLTSFPLIDTSSGTSFGNEQGFGAWVGCTSLSSFPLIDTSKGVNFNAAWYGCTNLRSFPPINTSSAGFTNLEFARVWGNCINLTSFPWINTSNVGAFGRSTITEGTWYNCSSLTSFPAIDTSSSSNFFYTWAGCTSLSSFPQINVQNLNGSVRGYGGRGIDAGGLAGTWYNCKNLKTFPILLGLSSCTFLDFTWAYCSQLTAFPMMATSNVFEFDSTWMGCGMLSATDFPTLNMSKMTNGTNCFNGVKLTTNSYSALLTSLCATNLERSVVFHGGNSNYNPSVLPIRNELTSPGAMKYSDSHPFFIKLNDGKFFYSGVNTNTTATETYLGTISANTIEWIRSTDLPIPMYSRNTYAYGYTHRVAADQLSDGRIILFDGVTTTIGELSANNTIKWTTDTSLNYPQRTGSYGFTNTSLASFASTIMKGVSAIYVCGGRTGNWPDDFVSTYFFGKIQPNNTMVWLSGNAPISIVNPSALQPSFSNSCLQASGNKIVIASTSTTVLNNYGTLVLGEVNTSTGNTSFSSITAGNIIWGSITLDGNMLLSPYSNLIATVNFNTNTVTFSSLSTIGNWPNYTQARNIILETNPTTVRLLNYGLLPSASSWLSTTTSSIITINKLNRTESYSRFGGSAWTITDGGVG